METNEYNKHLSDLAVILPSFDRDIESLKSVMRDLRTTSVGISQEIPNNDDLQQIGVCTYFAMLLLGFLDDTMKHIKGNIKSYNRGIMKEQPKS